MGVELCQEVAIGGERKEEEKVKKKESGAECALLRKVRRVCSAKCQEAWLRYATGMSMGRHRGWIPRKRETKEKSRNTQLESGRGECCVKKGQMDDT